MTHAELIADCERRAKEGEKPVFEWEAWPLGSDLPRFHVVPCFNSNFRIYDSSSYLAPDAPHHLCFGIQTEFAGFVQLYHQDLNVLKLAMETLLRDATLPLHREAYDRIAALEKELELFKPSRGLGMRYPVVLESDDLPAHKGCIVGMVKELDECRSRIAALESRLAEYEAQPLYNKEAVGEAYRCGYDDGFGHEQPRHSEFDVWKALTPFTPEAADA